jgi:pseudouridine kinase
MSYFDITTRPDAPALVIGAAGIDLVGRMNGELHYGTSNPARIRTSFGGVARNVAENLARLGTPVSLLTVVGSDDVGGRLIKQAMLSGIDTSRIMSCDQQFTGSYLAVIDRKGNLSFALDDMRIIRMITPEYLKSQAELFETASIVFLDMNLEPRTIRTAVSLARKAGLPIFSDPTSATLAKRMIPYLPDLFFITPNIAEAQVLSGLEIDVHDHNQVLEVASHLVGKGVNIVVITLAEFGLCYASSDERGYIPAIRTEILDPTGAGDALTAAVIFAILNDISLDEAMRLGISAASLTLRYPGAVRPDLSLEELYNHLVI